MLKTRRKRRIRIPLTATTILIGAALLLVGAYTTYVTLPFFKGPAVSVLPLSETPEGALIIRGTTERVSKLTINELEVPLAEDGTFAVERAYPEGYTVVIITASDRFGRFRSETLNFVTHHASQKENRSEESDPEEGFERTDVEE